MRVVHVGEIRRDRDPDDAGGRDRRAQPHCRAWSSEEVKPPGSRLITWSCSRGPSCLWIANVGVPFTPRLCATFADCVSCVVTTFESAAVISVAGAAPTSRAALRITESVIQLLF